MKIAIVGEVWGDAEVEAGTDFAGYTGRLLRGLCRQSGIDPAQCLLTNVFKLKPPGGSVEGLCGSKTEAIPGWNFFAPKKYVRAEFQPELDRLFKELNEFQPDCIIGLGNAPLWALCKKTGVKKFRGTPMLTWGEDPWKFICTWPPGVIQRQWNLRPIALADFGKALRVAAMPELKRPRREIWVEPTLDDIAEFYALHIANAAAVSADIETAAGQITEIGFAPDPHHALVIPFYSRSAPDGNYWKTQAEELKAWGWVRTILQTKPSFGQNYLYDLDYLWRTVGIAATKACDDTMLLHHALQPELEKGLGFLASIYTDEPSWKMMRQDNETLKKED